MCELNILKFKTHEMNLSAFISAFLIPYLMSEMSHAQVVKDNSQNFGRIAGFFVYVSNTTSKDDGYLCYHDESADQNKVSLDQHINCTLQGRYVIYYNERGQGVQYPNFSSQYAYNDLCEMEVYGCDGTYGDDCFYPCPTNCLDRKCDTDTGHCLGCSPGYKGQRCNQATLNLESNLTNIYQNVTVEKSKVEKRSRKAAATRELSRESRNDDVDIDEKIHNENPYGDVYVNQERISDILIKDLEKEIQEKSKTDNDGFKKEYARLLYGERHPCNVGKLPENIPKNRFKTTFPCNAGIGRTGTYIAIDVLFEAGKTEKKINIAEYVKKMRQNRMNMVQTFEQYKTIFLTLNEMFKAPAAALNKTEFLRKDFCPSGLITQNPTTRCHHMFRVLDRQFVLKSNETWSVNVIQPSCVLSFDSSQTVSQIVGMVSFTQKITTNNPIIVVSRDGAALCGVFCAVNNLIQQLTMDEEIDVFSVVRLLQTRRPEMCSSLEEYRMIHDTLKSFIQSPTGENVYSN
uniref:Leukocyte common antigen n=1 Tax=Magallana gigas TaxID=29159 RepID=K1PLA4_MAGGI